MALTLIKTFALLLTLSLSILACQSDEEPFVERAIEQACTEDEDSPCSPRDAGDIWIFNLAMLFGDDSTVPSVEEVLEKGLYQSGASPVHIVSEGAAETGSVRGHWRGRAMTLSQREETIRAHLQIDDDKPLPPPDALEAEVLSYLNSGVVIHNKVSTQTRLLSIVRGGFSDEVLKMTCYADYDISRYALGSGPGNVTVAYEFHHAKTLSYDLYKRSHANGVFGSNPLPTESEYQQQLDEQVSGSQSALGDKLEGRPVVVFLAPLGAYEDAAIEAWQAVEQWDLQEAGRSAVNAVRYGAEIDDPEYSQSLANLRTRISDAASSDAFADSRITSISGLTDYYREIGAYEDLTPDDGSDEVFTPAQPPSVQAQ